MLKLLTVILLVTSAQAFRRVQSGRIVGGAPIDISQAPWQVALLWNLSQFCGGSIIGPSWVLSAAHCTDDGDFSGLSIRAGSTQWRSGGELRQVVEIINHAAFNWNNFDSDICLLRLASPLVYSSTIAAIALPVHNQAIADGIIARVSGWGVTHITNFPEDLNAVDVRTKNWQACYDAYFQLYGAGAITQTMVCAGNADDAHDSCQGKF